MTREQIIAKNDQPIRFGGAFVCNACCEDIILEIEIGGNKVIAICPTHGLVIHITNGVVTKSCFNGVRH